MVEVQSSLNSALKEMRGIAAGLSLPQLSELSLPETVIRAVRSHERRTGTQVELELESVPDQVPEPLKITVYRLVQEALNNAYRHAGGIGQQVRVNGQGSQLVVVVSDSGPGFHGTACWLGRSPGPGWDAGTRGEHRGPVQN
jgi:signal transduction histidine kinase